MRLVDNVGFCGRTGQLKKQFTFPGDCIIIYLKEDCRGMAAEGENRKVKDSVFVDLFGRDVTAKENFISLYNALHGTNLRPENTELVPEMLESAMYMSYANDVAMQVNGQVVVLIEHQSTINRNMPLRLLDYVARIYEKIVPAKKKYYRSRVCVPMPEFYVLYNGTDDYPAEDEMRLSDSFTYPGGKKPSQVPLELVVKVYNINLGKGDALLGKCGALRQYSQFIGLVRKARTEGKDEPLTWAVKEAIGRGILPGYLERKSTEVINMLTMEYDYAVDVAAQKEESLAEGIRIGEERGLERGLEQGLERGLEQGLEQERKTIRKMMENLHLSITEVMDALNIPPSERDSFAAKL